jgi:hypothetical protein
MKLSFAGGTKLGNAVAELRLLAPNNDCNWHVGMKAAADVLDKDNGRALRRHFLAYKLLAVPQSQQVA